MRLEGHHRAILQVLDENEARRTKEVSADTALSGGVGGNSLRIASANCRYWLIELQTAGLVIRVDDHNFAAWRRTAKGTAVLGLMR